MDWLELDINNIGCRLSDLVVTRSRARLIGPEFESREAGSWTRTAEESYNRTKRQSSASRFFMVV